MFLKDFVINDRIPPSPPKASTATWPYRFGHAVLDFMVERHGEEGSAGSSNEYRTTWIPPWRRRSSGPSTWSPSSSTAVPLWLRERYLPALAEWGEPEQYDGL